MSRKIRLNLAKVMDITSAVALHFIKCKIKILVLSSGVPEALNIIFTRFVITF